MENSKKNILFRDIINASKFVGSKHDILNSDLRTLSKTLLNFLIRNVENKEDGPELEFNELRENYIKIFNIDSEIEVPVKEKDFHEHICRKFLFIEVNNTQNKIYEIVKQIVSDLKEIRDDKNRYQQELQILKAKPTEDGDSYEEKLLIHYLKKQNEAERQIINFIINNLISYANKNKHIGIFGFRGGIDFHYSYSWNRIAYKKEYLSEIVNKVLHVSMDRYFKLEKIYRTDKKKFLKEVQKDVKIKDVIENIRLRISSSHLLNDRRAILEDLIQLFQLKKYELFCNVAPQLIEGILYDYCLESGIKESSLVNSSLVEKINLLDDAGDHHIKISYEYFAFIFPVIRNRIAHGKKLEGDFYLLSWTLLMDLNYVCDLLGGSGLLTNKKIELINDVFDDQQLNKLIMLGGVINAIIPSFYKEEIKKLSKLKDRLSKELTVENFSKSVTYSKDEEKLKLIENLKALKRSGINEQECNKILRSMK